MKRVLALAALVVALALSLTVPAQAIPWCSCAYCVGNEDLACYITINNRSNCEAYLRFAICPA